MNKKNTRKGFTITELVIVIAVIAILAAVLIPTFSGIITKAQDSAALQEARADYTEYMADVEYADGATPTENIIFKTTNGKYVAVVDGKMSDTIYDSTESAKAAYTGGTVTVDTETVVTGDSTYTYYKVTIAPAQDGEG